MIVSAFFFTTWVEGLFVDDEDYVLMLDELVGALARLDPVPEIILKPHPTQESHEPHLAIQRRHPDIPITVSLDPLPATAAMGVDIVVNHNCNSTLTFYSVSQDIPIVSHRGALTPLAKRIFGTAGLSGSEDAAELAALISSILEDPGGPAAREARKKALEVARRYVQPSIGTINEALRAALDH